MATVYIQANAYSALIMLLLYYSWNEVFVLQLKHTGEINIKHYNRVNKNVKQ